MNRVEPELGDARFTLHVDMLGLISITGVEEKPIRSDTRDSGPSDYPWDAMRLRSEFSRGPVAWNALLGDDGASAAV
jgi:hypothetical protein